jgi:hypothetical protein
LLLDGCDCGLPGDFIRDVESKRLAANGAQSVKRSEVPRCGEGLETCGAERLCGGATDAA